ncbi:MAG: hypothetical protein WAV20_16325 [Blastocatellia bacterium]
MALKNSRLLIRSLTICAVIMIGGCEFPFSRPHPGKVIDSWETGNGTFRIRVIEREEEGGALRAALYFFQSTAVGAEEWSQFLMVRDKDMPSIPREQISFVTSEVAYVFMRASYCITTDAGKTWSLWEGEKHLPDWHLREYGVIRGVALNKDGNGTMTLGPAYEPTAQAKLNTSDYGRNWNLH